MGADGPHLPKKLFLFDSQLDLILQRICISQLHSNFRAKNLPLVMANGLYKGFEKLHLLVELEFFTNTLHFLFMGISIGRKGQFTVQIQLQYKF